MNCKKTLLRTELNVFLTRESFLFRTKQIKSLKRTNFTVSCPAHHPVSQRIKTLGASNTYAVSYLSTEAWTRVLGLHFVFARQGLHLPDGVHAHVLGQHGEQRRHVHDDGLLIWQLHRHICESSRGGRGGVS